MCRNKWRGFLLLTKGSLLLCLAPSWSLCHTHASGNDSLEKQATVPAGGQVPDSTNTSPRRMSQLFGQATCHVDPKIATEKTNENGNTNVAPTAVTLPETRATVPTHHYHLCVGVRPRARARVCVCTRALIRRTHQPPSILTCSSNFPYRNFPKNANSENLLITNNLEGKNSTAPRSCPSCSFQLHKQRLSQHLDILTSQLTNLLQFLELENITY